MVDANARELLLSGMSLAERKVDGPLVDQLLEDFAGGLSKSPAARAAEPRLEGQLLAFLLARVSDELGSISALRKRYAEYVKRYSRATSPEDSQRHILEFARDLGASSRALRGDRAAFGRWFGHEAICERYACRIGLGERRIVFELGRIGLLAEVVLGAEREELKVVAEWSRIGLEQKLRRFFAYEGDPRVSTAAFRALARALQRLPAGMRERVVEERTLQFIYRCAMHSRLDVWLQCEAISLLESLSPTSLEKVLRQRLTRPGPGDDLFVRRRAVLVLGANLGRLPELVDLFPSLAADPSPFVRQAFAEILVRSPADAAERWSRHLARRDPVPQVRAAAVLQVLEQLRRPDLRQAALGVLGECIQKEDDVFVLRMATHVAAEGTSALFGAGDPFADTWRSCVHGWLEELHSRSTNIPVKRYAAQARERVWCDSEPRARELRKVLERCIRPLGRSEAQWLPHDIADLSDADLVGRVLSVLAQTDFVHDVEARGSRARLTRGDVFGFRWWRFLHELRNPSPDKRQAFPHTIGRIYRGTLRAPSAILCELAETRVPGEPLFLAEEGGWRPYVPLPDDFLSSLRFLGPPEPVHLYTSEGVTEIVPPPSWKDRVLAHWRLSTRFVAIAKLRNWRQQLQESPASYLRAMQDLGFVTRIRPHGSEDGSQTRVDPDVQRFFPAFVPLPFTDIVERFREYFVSVYSNSLFDLALFAGLATTLFLGRHLYTNHTVRRYRADLPLVIGGWGTRGKSGTERLKAALMNALGYGVVSKTTGCEAMFLFAHPFMKTREMFLFRSYDKATIWEQKNVLRLAHGLHAEVFLWECMALTPSYVEVLQRHWVRDDLSTITNTYPDHEDLQGPAGINIPEVISIFIPSKATLVTSEEVMLPILLEEARKQETDVRKVTWIDSGLLAPDVMKRFPYDEHPSNVALVLALADELGIPRDFAIKEIADRVVPDLGVLKTFPVAHVCGRRLQFSNGMSANERHGTISNWVRCGFYLQDPAAEPGVWITTVVNNRADRVPRSRVFARILVEDISADRHFLIGGNLTGLVGYVRQSWDAYAPTISLWPKDAPPEPSKVLLEMARRFRLPTERAHVLSRLVAMLAVREIPPGLKEIVDGKLDDPKAIGDQLIAAGYQDHVQAILEHHEQSLRIVREYQELDAKILQAGPGPHPALDQEFRELLWKWFLAKIVVVEDYYISGEQLNYLIAQKTPPGYINRVMGIQNIKGTGLDFVYRWQAWDACHRACSLLESNDPQLQQQGLRSLSSFHEYGVLSREHVQKTLEKVKGAPALQSEGSQAELAMISSSFEHAMKELEEKLRSQRRKASRFEKVLMAIEAFLDAGDAVRRRRLANRIYKDLMAKRISTERAVYELQQLNKRQKGGWLLHKLEAAQSAIARNLSRLAIRSLK